AAQSVADCRRSLAHALGRIATISTDPSDDEGLASRKAPAGRHRGHHPAHRVWGSLYLALGTPAGLIANPYLLISAGIDAFARNRDVQSFLRVELLDILLAGRTRRSGARVHTSDQMAHR
ncbi:MAG: hypothetical protein ACT4OQ_10055, partial [Chloroflexota bacterium]